MFSGAKEEAHFEGEPDGLLRLDEGGDGGGHRDGEVACVGALDELEERPEKFACLTVGKLALNPLVANPPG